MIITPAVADAVYRDFREGESVATLGRRYGLKHFGIEQILRVSVLAQVQAEQDWRTECERLVRRLRPS